ncbi:hypothetical protein ACWGJ2_26465, partial [Streptomyces sp. NPDC054796]
MTRELRAGQAQDEPDLLRDQFSQLLRYRWTVTAGLLLGLLGGAWLGLGGGDTYAADSEVTLRQATVDPFAAGGTPADAGISIESERQTAAGSAVGELAARELDVRDTDDLQQGLEVTNPPNTLVLRFTYSSGSAKEAARRSNAFARAFLEYRERQTEAQVEKMLDGYRAQRKPLLGQRGTNEAADAQLSVLDSKIADLAAIDTTPGTVVRTAVPPTTPSGPGLPMLLALGGAVGLGLGLLGAWVRLVFDPAARSRGDVVRALGAPVLGTLPRGRRSGPLLAEGRTAEEYRSMAFRLAHDQRLADRRLLLVAAPRGDGGTAAAVSVNLAASFVELGEEVLLVEADLRTPSLAGRLRGADGIRPGWARTPSRGDGGWPTGLQIPIDAGESGAFDLVPGARVRNAARALVSTPATRLFAQAEEPGTTVVVLAPAVLSYADAVALADRVGGVLVVCDPREVRRADLARIRELITGAGGTVLGAVLHSTTGGAGPSPGGLLGRFGSPGRSGRSGRSGRAGRGPGGTGTGADGVAGPVGAGAAHGSGDAAGSGSVRGPGSGDPVRPGDASRSEDPYGAGAGQGVGRGAGDAVDVGVRGRESSVPEWPGSGDVAGSGSVRGSGSGDPVRPGDASRSEDPYGAGAGQGVGRGAG